MMMMIHRSSSGGLTVNPPSFLTKLTFRGPNPTNRTESQPNPDFSVSSRLYCHLTSWRNNLTSCSTSTTRTHAFTLTGSLLRKPTSFLCFSQRLNVLEAPTFAYQSICTFHIKPRACYISSFWSPAAPQIREFYIATEAARIDVIAIGNLQAAASTCAINRRRDTTPCTVQISPTSSGSHSISCCSCTMQDAAGKFQLNPCF